MKILVISNLYPPYVIGGYELLAFSNTTGLLERGHEVHIATGRGEAFIGDNYVHPIYDIDLETKTRFYTPVETPEQHRKQLVYDPQIARQTYDLMEKIKPDLVSIWSLWQLSLAPIVAANRYGCPSVIHLTDTWLLKGFDEYFNAAFPAKGRLGRIKRLGRAIARRAFYTFVNPRNIIIPSLSLKRTHTDVNFGFPDDAFYLLPHAIETADFPYQEPAERETDEPLRLLYAGSLWEGKGAHVLLMGLAVLRDRGLDDFHLSIYGHGAAGFVDYLQNIIDQHELNDYVEFCGTVPYKDLVHVYRAHDILVFPSTWNEPFALVPLEAMSCGMAIVGSTAGGTPEAIRHEETGLVFESENPHALADQLERLIDDADLRRDLGQRASVVARAEYDRIDYLNRVEAYYQRVIKEQTPV